jgi:hypothetical protein
MELPIDDPFESARQEVLHRLDDTVEEQDLESTLAFIVEAARRELEWPADGEVDRGRSWQLVDSVHAWASLASYATGRFYLTDRPTRAQCQVASFDEVAPSRQSRGAFRRRETALRARSPLLSRAGGSSSVWR